MHTPSRLTVLTVLASLMVGAGAGVIASVLTSQAIEDYAVMLLGDRGFTAFEPRKPNTNPLNYDEAARRVGDTQAQSLAVITRLADYTELPSQWIGPADSLGLGMVVSANGWVLTTEDELAPVQNLFTGYQVWVRGKSYTVEQVVRDDLTDFVMLKLQNASGLTPVGFGASEDAVSGDQVFVLNSTLGFLSARIENSEHLVLSGPQPAEVYTTAWKLASSESVHGPVLSGAGELLAFAGASGKTVPFHHGVAAVQEIIRTNASAQAALGAYVIDLASVYNLDPDLRQNLQAGALVIALAGRLAVPVRGPAGEAGILSRDIITAVEGEAVTATVSLAEILSAYDPGQTVRLSIHRAGAPIEISVTLMSASDLIY